MSTTLKVVGVSAVLLLAGGLFVYFRNKKTDGTIVDMTKQDVTEPAIVPQNNNAVVEQNNATMEAGIGLLAQEIAKKIANRELLLKNKPTFTNIIQSKEDVNQFNRQLLDLGYKYVDGKAVKL